MKQRILLWIVILITPTTLWFLLSDDGRDAFQLMFSKTTVPGEKHLNINIEKPDAPILIPVNQKPRQAAITVYITPAVAGAILIDSKNRKTGFNSFSETKFFDIPNSSVQLQKDGLLVKIEPSSETQYQLHIMNKNENTFNLSVRGVSPNGDILTKISSPWLQANRLVVYDINLKMVKNMSLSGRHTVHKGDDFMVLREERVAIVKNESLYEICDKIKGILASAVGNKFNRSDGDFSFNDKIYNGCRFYFSDTAEPDKRIDLPSEFYLGNNSQLAKDGWRQDTNLAAGGPDGSLLILRKQHQFCVISERHDGGVDDDPSYIPSNDYSIDIECSEEAGV